ncbi:helix-turn-helix transcriptional regulator [Sphaerisporangium perillae]|uniref:helix-turn-helix transcriptional regulator n=1 Tax=Sphaerisporangium perillae TaxID=2935860 RepID=UPI00200F1CD5|nr:YafY family protein [Sphaerisporangium perillae]
MLETSARLLRLLSLLQSRRDWSGAELAERLGVDVRTVRRDIDKLRGLGYPVHSATGTAGGYRLGAGAALPPLLLDDEEAVAVAIGLRTAASGTVAGMEETSVRALAKLEQVLPARLRRQVNALHAATVPLAGHAPAVDPGVLTAIAAACRDRLRMRFGYRGHDGTESRRVVEPHRLVHTPRRWYLLAWDTEREDWRTFRVDRMRDPAATGPRFTPHTPPENAAAYVSRAISSTVYRYQARILMRAPIEVVAERSSPTAGRLEAVDEHTCVLHTGSDSLDQIALYVGLKGIEFEVLDPPELVEHIRRLSELLARAAR